jgi:hypothetical protein
MSMGIHSHGRRVGYGHGTGSNVGIRVNLWILWGDLELDTLVGWVVIDSFETIICTTHSVSQAAISSSHELPVVL